MSLNLSNKKSIKTYELIGRDLTGVDFSGADLSNIN